MQSTLVISQGLSEILRGIRTSTYQICRNEEKINRTRFHKLICNLIPEFREKLKILQNKSEIAPIIFPTVFCYLFLDSHVKQEPNFHFEISGYFEKSEVEIRESIL